MSTRYTLLQWTRRILITAFCLLGGTGCVKVVDTEPARAQLGQLNALSLTFDTVVVGDSISVSATIDNSGTEAASDVKVALPELPFNLDSTTCGELLPAGTSCEIHFSFTPTAPGLYEATVKVSFFNGYKTTELEVQVAGEALSPASLSLSGLSSFGPVVIGDQGIQAVTVTNEGQAEAIGLDFAALAAPFEMLSNTCGANLGGGQSCALEIGYSPAVSGADAGTLSISYDNGLGAASVSEPLSGSGLTPALLTMTGSGTMGGVTLGLSRTARFVVNNVGQATATDISPFGADLPFSISDLTCGASLVGGGSCYIEVTYLPTDLPAAFDSVGFNYQDGAGAQVVMELLFGLGLSPAVLEVDPGRPYSFGSVTVGSGATHSFTLSNVGDTPATLAMVVPAGPFSVSGGTCGSSLSGGGTCTLEIRFAPTSNTGFSETLEIPYDDGVVNQAISISLSGSGLTPASLALSPSGSHSFGDLVAGLSATQVVSITNSGESDAPLSFAALGAPFAVESTTCDVSLPAGGSCDATLSFAPTSAGAASDTFTVDYSDGAASQSVGLSLSGNGVAPANLSLAPSHSHDFGTVWLGDYADATFTVSNDGGVEAASISIGFAGDFSLAGGTCGASLAAGSSCTLVVRFSPASAGAASDSPDLAYETGAGTASIVLSLAGVGKKQSIFVTSQTYQGALGGLTGADEKCRTLASAQGLAGSWRAILSDTSTDAFSRFSIPGHVYDSLGNLVANASSDLTSGSLSSSIQYDESGADRSGSRVWTGTLWNGWRNILATCSNWDSSALLAFGQKGGAGQTDGDWLGDGVSSCLQSNRLYCLDAPGGFSDLVAFTATTGNSNGRIKLHLEFPESTAQYDQVKILRASGSTAPSCTEHSATEIATLTSFTTTNLTDNTGNPALKYAYRACVYDGSGTAITSSSASAYAKAPHILFVTSTSYNGNLGGLAGGDAKCQAQAAAAGLPGTTWKALLSDASTDVKNRISVSGTIYNLMGENIAGSDAGLWDSNIANDVRYDETGSSVGITADVWTGSNANGTRNADTCTSWTSSASTGVNGRIGDPLQDDADWMADSRKRCDVLNRLYCISQ